MTVDRGVERLFAPKSVVVLGASSNPTKWGNWIARGALRGEAERQVYLVNQRGGEVLGRVTFRSLDELPGTPDLAVVALPEAALEEAVTSALAIGTRDFVVITAGLGEVSEAGRGRETALAQKVRDAGGVMVGPNCLGLFDASNHLYLGLADFPPGEIGFISQSGILGLEVASLASDYAMGFSRFVSLGNQADLQAADFLPVLARHSQTRVIAVYCEDFRDGRMFARLAKESVDSGKPVVLLAGGTSEQGIRAARSHTGGLATDHQVVLAACRAAGILLVRTPKELVDAAQVLSRSQALAGPRIGVVSDGGGHSVIAADVVASSSLRVAAFSESLRERLADLLPPNAATGNPVDFAGAGERDIRTFERVTRVVRESDEVDGVLLTGSFGGYAAVSDAFAEDEVSVAKAIAGAAATGLRPLVVHTIYSDSPAAAVLRRGGVAVYRHVEAAVRSLEQLAELGRALRKPGKVPDAGPNAGRSGSATIRHGMASETPLLPGRVPGFPFQPLSYWEARALLQPCMLFPPARQISDLADALSAAQDLGYPVTLKALGILHKSDLGGVSLNLTDDKALTEAFSRMSEKFHDGSFCVERMVHIPDGIELIVGARRDVRFGPVVLVGFGGIYAEVFWDYVVSLAPIDQPEAEELFESLRGAPLLLGHRGRSRLAIEAAARALVSIGDMLTEFADLEEIEVNPLLVGSSDVVALDARAVLQNSRTRVE